MPAWPAAAWTFCHRAARVLLRGAGVPVVPVTLIGPRHLLPDGHWWPRRGALDVRIDASLDPEAATELFAAAVKLRDAAHATIARRLDAGQ